MTSTEKSIDYQYEKVPISENGKEIDNKEIARYGFGVRHVQTFVLFVCLTTSFIARGHLGVTIVAMVDPSTYADEVTSNVTDNVDAMNTMQYQNVNTSGHNHGINASDAQSILANTSQCNVSAVDDADSIWNTYRTYKWPKPKQEMILSSFFLGYFILMIPMGWVSQRWGGKLPMQICLLINGIISILTPWIVAWGGWQATCACRVLQGLSQAGCYPGTISLLAAWVPLSERGSLSTYVFTGTGVGTVVAFQMGGLLAASRWGWPAIFWATGVLCLLAFGLITVFGAATPQEHKFISDEEKYFILGHSNTETLKSAKTPWRAILSSRPVWAAFVTHAGSGTTYYFILTQVSSYLHYVLGVDVGKSGLLSSLPYLASFLSCAIMGYVSDKLTNKNIISVKSARMLFNSIGGVGMAVCLATLSFIPSTILAVMCLIMTMIAQAGIHAGWMVNYMDLSPRYSGTLMATGNTLMNVCVLTLPMLVSNIVTDVSNVYQWRTMLLLVASFCFLTNAVYVAFMTSDLQPWDDQHYQNTDEEVIDIDAVKDKETKQ